MKAIFYLLAEMNYHSYFARLLANFGEFYIRDLHLMLNICESGENRHRDWP